MQTRLKNLALEPCEISPLPRPCSLRNSATLINAFESLSLSMTIFPFVLNYRRENLIDIW